LQHGQALSLLRPLSQNWTPAVLSVSSLESRGIDLVWATILEHAATLEAAGERQSRRAAQARAWMWSLVEEGLRQSFHSDPAVAGRIEQLEQDVEARRTTPAAAAGVLLEVFKNS
jgi:LAO/AO transport system kinase